MIKKWLSFALICLMLATTSTSFISAQIRTENDASSVVKIKAFIAKRGTGEKKRVEVKMLDGTKLKGYISQTEEDSFTLIDSETKQSASIGYRDVAKVNNRLSWGDKIAIGIVAGAAIGAAVILGVFFKKYCDNEGC